MKIHTRHILVEHEYEAEDLERRISHGEDFAELAKKYSQCSSNTHGGDLGFVEVKKLDEDFSEALQHLQAGEISKPVRTRFGWHLIQRMK